MVITYKDMYEILPFMMDGYGTSVPTSIGETPFSLVYGMEAILHVEFEILSLRVLIETKIEEAEWVQTRFEYLNLIEEKHLILLSHGKLYHRCLKKSFDKKVRPREFQQGNLVLKKILPIHKDSQSKWTPSF